MAKSSKLLCCCISIAFIFIINLLSAIADEDRKLHIVYMGSLPKEEYSPSSDHLNLLQGVVQNSNAKNLLVRSYTRSFNGFAALLSDSEAKQLASSNRVVSVFPSIDYELRTTRSWSFLGFEENAYRVPSAESNIIIGVMDTGIWPESESFNDEGFGPPPKKWKGSCSGWKNFTCNKYTPNHNSVHITYTAGQTHQLSPIIDGKIIGARNYITMAPYADTARDFAGHGTHTASTAAGRAVNEASFFGLANGTARGGTPSARIAVYRVCQSTLSCGDVEIMAAFDDAIADGVDVISISIGPTYPQNYTDDPIAIGSFHAIQNGIFVSQSAGNSGPSFGSVESLAPWILSVGASTTDRRILDKVILGNGKILVGNAVNTFDLKGQSFPLINGNDARSANCSTSETSSCYYMCLNDTLVKGKIVVCQNAFGSEEAKRAGAVASILQSNGIYEDVSYPDPLPSITLPYLTFQAVTTYMNSVKNPVAKLLKSEAVKDPAAPLVASFSSRGPNLIAMDLLKPDIVAPGVDILAAYSLAGSPSKSSRDVRRVKYSFQTGTSMACPHASGVAAYVKSFQPNWSPAAIKSAIMTTAFNMNTSRSSGAELDYGSGLLNPSGAVNPGLVYDAEKGHYLTFLCGLGYSESSIRLISGDNSTTCPRGSQKALARNLNYPTMSARVPINKTFAISFSRTVTNFGFPKSVYRSYVWSNSNLVNIEVVPEEISFDSINEKKTFSVTVTCGGLDAEKIVSSALLWNDGSHLVRSPIVIFAFQNV